MTYEKSSCLAEPAFFCEAEGLEPSCLPVPLPPTTAVVWSALPSPLGLPEPLAMPCSSVPSRQTKITSNLKL